MNFKSIAKHSIPPSVLNSLLLAFPFIYRWKLVGYESNLEAEGGLIDLFAELEPCLRLDGDIIECGSSRCGTSIIVANYLQSKRIDKQVLALDSFEGFPLDELRKERENGWNKCADNSFTSTSIDYVTKKIERLGVQGIVKPIKGFFEQTLPKLDGKFCFGLVDCDLQTSLEFCGDHIWPNLSSGGCLVFDDYTADRHKGARIGVTNFVRRNAETISAHGLLNRLYFARKM